MKASFSLRPFQEGGLAFPDLLNWDAFVAEGILFNQDGSFTACAYYSGPDLDSLPQDDRSALASHINKVLCHQLGTGWLINIDIIRIPSISYPQSEHFPNLMAHLIDQERKEIYEAQEAHYESVHTLTITWKPEDTTRGVIHKALGILKRRIEPTIAEEQRDPTDHLAMLITTFEHKVDSFLQKLAARIHVQRMDSQAMMRFLHQCVCGKDIPVHLPEPPIFIGHHIGSYDFTGGIQPKINDRYIGAVTIADFPDASYSGMLHELTTLPFEYRFSTRFIILDQPEAVQTIKKIRSNLHNKQFDLMTLVGFAFNTAAGQSSYRNEEAVEKAEDAAIAVNEARDGAVKYGYYSCAVIVYARSPEELKGKLEHIVKCLDARGFVSRIEQMNAVEAYLGSLPAHQYPNLRRPILHTLNLAHLIPLASIWAGREFCSNPMMPPQSPPLFFAKTTGNTPFRFDLYAGDVGHSAIFGPTGSGKSTLLGLMAAQYLRYPNAQVFVFEKGRSQYALASACNADHYDIQGDSTIALCPLARIDEPHELQWACAWMEDLLTLQGLEIDISMRNLIINAMQTVAHGRDKTLSKFSIIIQDKRIKEALNSFVNIADGTMAGLLDAETDGLSASPYQVFELEHVLNMDKRISVPVLLYLFHAIERRLDGRPSLIILDEAWVMFDDPLFASKIREWLKVLRKRNAAVVFATQQLSDVLRSPLSDVILESCQTRIYLPNARARSEEGAELYKKAGLNAQQIAIISEATPKQEYYVTSPLGERLIDLGMGELSLAFIGATNPQDIHDIRTLKQEHGDAWQSLWLQRHRLDRWAECWNSVTMTEEKEVA
jgi:type IV secretion system protein VirB4